MRLLASVGVFEATADRRFGLTDMGRALRSDAPVSVRPFAIMSGMPWSARAFEHFSDSVRTGIDGVSLAFGKNAFEVFADDPQAAEPFHEAMTNFSRYAGDAILQAYNFSGINRLADVGGGHGMLLAKVLRKYPDMRGVLFDLPGVTSGVPTAGHLNGLENRVSIEPGSFFECVPSGCDAYMMKHILHDWSDELCSQILRLIRSQIPDNGRLLVFDTVVPEDNRPCFAKMIDIEMLLHCVGGKERTAAEFAELFAAAAFRLEAIIDTDSPISIVEARPV
jgi:hypothetical protein